MGNDAKPDIQSIRKQAFQRYIAGHAGKWVEPEALFIVAMIQTEQNKRNKKKPDAIISLLQFNVTMNTAVMSDCLKDSN